MCARTISANDTIEKAQGRPEGSHIGYLSPTAIVRELRHAQSADVFACVWVYESEDSVWFREGENWTEIEKKVEQVKERAKNVAKVSGLQQLGGYIFAQLAESKKKNKLKKKIIIDIAIIPGAWERAWWILASLAPPARESRATEAVDIRACALASVRARSGRSMRAHWRGSRPPFARVCLCSRDPPSRPPRRRRPATVWVSAADAISTSPRSSRRNPADGERWGDCESSNFSNLLSGGAGGLPLRGARGRKRCSQTTSIYLLAGFFQFFEWIKI